MKLLHSNKNHITISSIGLRNVCTFPAKTRSKVANITTRGELGVIPIREKEFMHKILMLVVVCTLVGCAAAGVVYTNDPYQKVSNSYIMMSQGRPIPAERFAKEAFEQFKQDHDVFGQGESLVALGLLYKSRLKQDLPESVAKLEQAKDLFQSINDYSSLSKTKFALGNAYANLEQKEKQCSLYSESLQDYEKAKKLDPEASFQFNPAYPSFDAMVKDFKAGHCG